jgi:hypothetical protein
MNVDRNKYSISHPLADCVSVVSGPGTYSGENSKELAFFNNKKWVTEIIPEFQDHVETLAGDTMVYEYVPNKDIELFLINWGV